MVLHLEIIGEEIDVNVHPTKMELRFGHQQEVYQFLYQVIGDALHGKELIPEVEAPEPVAIKKEKISESDLTEAKKPNASKTENDRKKEKPVSEEKNLDYFMEKMKERVKSYHEQHSCAEVKDRKEVYEPAIQKNKIREAAIYRAKAQTAGKERQEEKEPEQLSLFEEKLLDKTSVPDYRIIGQVFDTYWIVQFHDSMYIIDQHAAHERVLYEKTLKEMKTKTYTSQYISPPIILDLSMQEAELLRKYMDRFTKIGLSEEVNSNLTPEILDEKIASMSCKAAVKGNYRLSQKEVEVLLDELLKLDNPYHCPHGRPTIIAMTKRELEKKFKRII